ncbi:MAG TPA: hypothetical protein EYP69_04070 [Bacteroidales bacterium]|nr:hypothetical protein [Bacteroidales bacterium]
MEMQIPKQQRPAKPKSFINSFWFGLASGLLVPLLTIIIAYYQVYAYMDFERFYIRFVHLKLFSAFISLCALPDMLVFFLFIWSNRLLGARGVLTAIFIITVIVVIFKFFI